MPVVAYFAVTRLSRQPRAALGVLALQAVAGLTALAALFVPERLV